MLVTCTPAQRCQSQLWLVKCQVFSKGWNGNGWLLAFSLLVVMCGLEEVNRGVCPIWQKLLLIIQEVYGLHSIKCRSRPESIWLGYNKPIVYPFFIKVKTQPWCMTQVSTQDEVCINTQLLLNVKYILTRVDSNNSFGVNCCRHTVSETVKTDLGICDEENFEKRKQEREKNNNCRL